MNRISWSLAAAALGIVLSVPAQANASHTRHFFSSAVPSTGFNRANSLPIWKFPHLEQFIPVLGPFVVFAGFNTSGIFDPAVGEGGGDSFPALPSTPGSALTATHFDALGMSFLGVSPPSVPDSKRNVKIDNVEILIDDFGVDRGMVPCATETSVSVEITRAGPCTDDVTHGDWLSAQGFAHVRCFDDGSANLRQWVWNLLPNRLYSTWYVEENFAAGPEKLISAFPFGGVPNTIVTNKWGYAQINRDLGFCPYDQEGALSWVVALRSNGQNFGGVPVPFLNQEDPTTAFDGYVGLIPGTAINVQLSWNLGGVGFDPSELPPL